MKKSPFLLVKEQFESKEKLVRELMKFSTKLFDRPEDQEKDALEKMLLKASNQKLLKLHHLGKAVEKQWGSKEKLVDALLKHQNRAKDKDYREKLLGRSIAWLYSHVKPFERPSRKESSK